MVVMQRRLPGRVPRRLAGVPPSVCASRELCLSIRLIIQHRVEVAEGQSLLHRGMAVKHLHPSKIAMG